MFTWRNENNWIDCFLLMKVMIQFFFNNFLLKVFNTKTIVLFKTIISWIPSRGLRWILTAKTNCPWKWNNKIWFCIQSIPLFIDKFREANFHTWMINPETKQHHILVFYDMDRRSVQEFPQISFKLISNSQY